MEKKCGEINACGFYLMCTKISEDLEKNLHTGLDELLAGVGMLSYVQHFSGVLITA